MFVVCLCMWMLDMFFSVLACLVHQCMPREKIIDDPTSVVLVVIENVNQNQIDQRVVCLGGEGSSHRPDCQTESDTQCDEQISLSADRHLLLRGSHVVIVYFRCGYSPENYPTENEWAARLTIELSDAIKAPCIALQVANTKKTQQELTEDRVVERLACNPREAAATRNTFSGLWAISCYDPITVRIIKGVISHPDKFVLKPQLEGGGGNFYGENMAEKLKLMSKEERGAHILMGRIQPLVVQNYLVRAMQPVSMSDVVGELGIYGYALGNEGAPELVTGGHLLRTKGEKTDEGGVAVGAAVIDIPFLFEML